MYHNFDDDNWNSPKRSASGGKSGKDDLLLIGMLSLFFVLLVVGGIVYYNQYLKTQNTQTVQAKVAVPTTAPNAPVIVETTEPEEEDPEYTAITADMDEEEKAAYDAYLLYRERFENAEITYPITQTVYKDPTVFSNTLVFILSFDNQPLQTDSDLWSDFFFGEKGYYNTGSIKSYYKEVSHGTIAVRPAKETQGTKNDGIIRLNMNESHPEFTGAFYSSPNSEKVMDTIFSFIKKVMVKGDEYVDYSAYDIDGDGDVESNELDVILIFAGYEDAYIGGAIPNTTYSAQAWFYDRSINLDGVRMNEAIMTAELSPLIKAKVPVTTMGALCHEMGHAMGLPDLYDTDYSSEGLAFHSLMAAGSYNFYDGEIGSLPPPLMAWSLTQLGAVEPEVVTDDALCYLWSRSSENYNIIKIPASDGYYLVENVDFEGYGQGLSLYVEEPGIAIWYIDNNVLNSLYATYNFAVNDDEFRPGVRLVEPNGGRDLLQGNFDRMKVYDHYFRLSGDNHYTGAYGVIIDILDDPGEVMRIQVTVVG